MALVETLFSEYPDGAPADWTDFWGTGDITATVESNAAGDTDFGTKWLKYETNANDRSVLTWDDLGNMSDVCVIFKIRSINIATNGIRLFLRVSGSDGAESCYFVFITSSIFTMSRYLAGASTNLDSVTFVGLASTEYWVKFQAIGTAIKAKIWNADSVEPEDWLLEATDSGLASGAVGIGAYDSGQDYYLDYIGADSSEIGIPDAYEDDVYFNSTEMVTSSAGFLNHGVALGGYFSSANRKLKGVRVYCKTTHDDQIRVAVYSGGNLVTGPQGATLLKDFGLTSGAAVDQYIEITTADDINIPVDTPLWVVVKGDNAAGFKLVYTIKTGHPGDFQSARGRTDITAIIGKDPDVVFADTFPAGAGSFADSWYLLGIKTEESSGEVGWTGIFNGISSANIAKINGVAVANIASVMGK